MESPPGCSTACQDSSGKSFQPDLGPFGDLSPVGGGFAFRKGWCHSELGSPAWCRNEFPMLNAGALLWDQGCGSALCWLWGKDAGDVPGAALVRSGRERGRACRGQELVLEGVRV